MTMNYRETGKPYSESEWTKGIQIMTATAEKLEKDGLLPKEFPSPEIKFRHAEVLRMNEIGAEVEKQVLRYKEFGFSKKLKMTNEKFKDQIMGLVTPQPEKYRGRFDIPIIVLGSKIWARQQYESIGFNYNVNIIAIESYDPRGYEDQRSPHLVWMQDGTGKSASGIKWNSFHNDERGANVFDGVGLMVARPDLLEDHFVVLPGSSFGAYKRAVLWKGIDNGQHVNMFNADVAEHCSYASCGR
jgi:hypothetical protein